MLCHYEPEACSWIEPGAQHIACCDVLYILHYSGSSLYQTLLGTRQKAHHSVVPGSQNMDLYTKTWNQYSDGEFAFKRYHCIKNLACFSPDTSPLNLNTSRKAPANHFLRAEPIKPKIRYRQKQMTLGCFPLKRFHAIL